MRRTVYRQIADHVPVGAFQGCTYPAVRQINGSVCAELRGGTLLLLRPGDYDIISEGGPHADQRH